MLNDDELPDDMIRKLRASPPLDPGAENRMVSLLTRRGTLRRAGLRVSPMTLALMAAAAIVAFIVGLRTGERRATRSFERTALEANAATALDPLRKGPPARGEFVLWF